MFNPVLQTLFCRAVVAGLLLMLTEVGVWASTVDFAADDPPNIILIMFDDLGYGDLGYQGSQHASTPHIDKMAESSLVFSRFYAAAPVCSPTRGTWAR